MSATPTERGSVLVITGPPGSGKSTVAPRLARRLGPSVACIESDWFWTTIHAGFVEPWRPESDHQNRTVLRAATSAAAELAIGGYRVVVDGVIGPWHLAHITSILDARGIGLDYAVLRPALATCLARAEARSAEPPRVPGHPPLAASGPIRHMWAQFADLGDYEAHVLDPTGHDPAWTVDRLEGLLAAGHLRIDPAT